VLVAARFAVILAAALLAAPMSCQAASHVVVVRRGWHIDVGFAASELEPRLQFAASALPTARYIFFGFGDMHYLEARSHGASTLAAALWPGRGIMLVTGIDATPQQAFGAPHVIELAVSDAQSSAMQAFIAQSFVTQNGSANVYQPGPYPGSVYFLATPKYSALHTCNTWAGEVLHAAPLRTRHWGVLFAGQLWSQVQRLLAEQLDHHPGSSPQPGHD
jgi:hypothetical protein